MISGIQPGCGQCGVEKPGMQRCSRCKKISYCSPECQKMAWKAHRAICIHESIIPNDEKKACFLAESGEARMITQREFKNLTGMTFVNLPIIAKHFLGGSDRSVASPAIETYDSVALSHQGKAGYGLVALRDIAKRSFICDFGGVVFSQEEWGSERRSMQAYLYCAAGNEFVFDVDKYASLGAFANDGPPNSELKTYAERIVYPGGVEIPIRKLLVATRDVQKGEEICIDYGPNLPIKNSPYILSESSMKRLMENHAHDLNFQLLNKTGWVLSALVSDQDNTDLVRASELVYLLITPYALAILHLRSDLDPVKSMESLEKLSARVKLGNETAISDSLAILRGLAKVKDKAAFAPLADKISQISLKHLCEALATLPKPPSVEDCEKLGEALDELRLFFLGTQMGSVWRTTEESAFRKQFTYAAYKAKFGDSSKLESWPQAFKAKYLELKAVYYKQFNSYFAQ